MSEGAKQAAFIAAIVLSVSAGLAWAGMWLHDSISRDIRKTRIAIGAYACVGNDIWNERRISECHAAATREVMRRDELSRRGYAPAKPEGE